MSTLLEQASLVLIPSGYKEDVVYSQIPTNGNGDLSFTRASNGTRVNSAGLVEVCPWNLLQQSETLSVSPWGIADVTITDNSQTAPNGTSTADVLTEGTGTAQHRIYQTTSFSSGIYTVSAYVKNITGTRQAYIDLGPFTAFFTFSTETIYSASGVASFEKLANGWYRISLTSANPITPSTIYVGLGQGNTETYTGNGTSEIAFWGIQYNIGSTAKPYFPTTDRLNVPRLTYQNGGGGCPSLLLEKQSTNLALYSEDFTNATWVKTTSGSGNAPTVTANAGTSPDGTANADRVQFDCVGTTTSDRSILRQSISITNGTAYTFSFYVKAYSSGEVGKELNIRAENITGNPTITLTADWQRVTVSGTASASSTLLIIETRGAVTANTTADILIWGAQLEASSYPTSYIPTTSASATRVADVAQKTGISSLIGQTEGVFYAEFTMPETQSPSFFSISDGTTANRIIFGYYLGALRYYTDSSTGSFALGGIIDASPIVGQVYKIALAYKNNDFVVYKNGTNTNTITTFTVPASLTQMDNAAGNAAQNIYASVKEILLFKTRLTNAELASLTTI
jgi:hypothetical protein